MRQIVRVKSVNRADPSSVGIEFEVVTGDPDAVELWLASAKHTTDMRSFPDELREGDELVLTILDQPAEAP